MRKTKAFTVMELMVAVVILTIVVSLASVGYGKYRDQAAMLVDETNEKVLLAAVKLYAYDTNALPGSLSQLRTRDLERAYALVTEGKRPYTFLAFLQENLGLLDIAEAVPPGLPGRYLGDNPARILKCPVDPTPPSYGITGGLNGAANKPLSWLLLSANAGATVIMESDQDNPTDLDFPHPRRHEGGRTYIRASASGVISRERGGEVNPAS